MLRSAEQQRTGFACALLPLAMSCCQSPHDSAGRLGTAAAATVSPAVTSSVAPSATLPPGFVVNLQPDSTCQHPSVTPDCNGGFCNVPAGCFVMGSPRDEPAAAANSDVQVQVTLTRPFELSANEVTNSEWEAEGFSPPLRDNDVGRCRDSNCPAANVNFYETLTFLNTYSERRGLPPCYELTDCTGTFGSGPICNRLSETPGNQECDRTTEDGLNCSGVHLTADSPYECTGYRLPTEAEWEYAARAGTRTAFWTGPITVTAHRDCVEEPNLLGIAWYCQNSGGHQHPVGEKPPNPWGFYDILGNVAEWTSDAIYGFGYGTSPLTDPSGYWYNLEGYKNRDLTPIVEYGGSLVRQDMIVMRGGSYGLVVSSNKASMRGGFVSIYQGSSGVGFRIARTLP